MARGRFDPAPPRPPPTLRVCPRHRSGQAFIHDPKILSQSEVRGSTNGPSLPARRPTRRDAIPAPAPPTPLPCSRRHQVKAQIKIRFTSVAAKPVVCTRSFSLTQKATKMEYKAFEAALQTLDEKNQKQALSYKCADLNKCAAAHARRRASPPGDRHPCTVRPGSSPSSWACPMPSSRASSSCTRSPPRPAGRSPRRRADHRALPRQEDSCWPLSDDATLKKRFDDIFAATQARERAALAAALPPTR